MKQRILYVLMIIFGISFSAYAQDKTNVTYTMEKKILGLKPVEVGVVAQMR